MLVQIAAFVRESNMIEGITRDPSVEELESARLFISLEKISLAEVLKFQSVVAPGKPIRSKKGMNVRVGSHFPKAGGGDIVKETAIICEQANNAYDPWLVHVDFELLHPFMDGNGRTGRMIWAWMMHRQGHDPFALSFLHRFYYQTLAHNQVCKS